MWAAGRGGAERRRAGGSGPPTEHLMAGRYKPLRASKRQATGPAGSRNKQGLQVKTSLIAVSEGGSTSMCGGCNPHNMESI